MSTPQPAPGRERLLITSLGRARRRGWPEAVEVIQALGRCGGIASISPLVGLLREIDPVSPDAHAVADALAAIAGRESTPPVTARLVERLRQTRDPAERYFGHMALARLRCRTAEPYLEEQVALGVGRRKPRTALRPALAAALHALGRIDSLEGTQTLIALEQLTDREDFILREALYAALAETRSAACRLSLPTMLDQRLRRAQAEGDPPWLLRSLHEAIATLERCLRTSASGRLKPELVLPGGQRRSLSHVA